MIPIASDNFEVSHLKADQVQPTFSSQLDLEGAFGKHIDAQALFGAITSLQKQAFNSEQDGLDAVLEEKSNAMDSLFSADFLLQMLLKVSFKLPSFDLNESKSTRDFIEVLIRISNMGRNDCEQEGKPRTYWEGDLSQRWANLIDNSKESNKNFYMPREYQLSQEEADEESDLKVLQDLGMQALMKQASTN